MIMRTISLLPTALATLFMATVHAAPAKQLQGHTLSCDWYDVLRNGQLSAGDYNYGSDAFKLGYKYFDQDDGTSIIRIVKVDPNRMTACDMHTGYKETSLGGQSTAVKVPVAIPDC